MLRKIVLCFVVFCCGAVFAEGIPTLKIPKVTKAPTMEQFLKGEPREAEYHVTGFLQREPGDGVPASQPTDAYISYDDKNLYIVFICKDDPGKVRAHLGKREQFDGDDIVGVLLDTLHDHQRGYGFFANPLGVQGDAIEAEQSNDDWSYDTLWYSDGRITSDGYVVWMAIPFRSLRFRQGPLQEWGIFLMRMITRSNEADFYPRFTRQQTTFLTQAGHVQGIENVSPGRNMQFIPYGFLAHSRSLDTNVPQFRTDNTVRGGFDSKVVLRDALTLDFTVNPDFSQIESDEPQVTVNQRYEVYFPERRPFFIENSDFFKTPEDLFFTRRIADPEFGSRLTGSIGRWKVAGLMMDDRAAGHFLPLSDSRREDRALIGIARVRREFGKQHSIGALFTNQSFAGTYNRVAGGDMRLFFGRNWTITGQAVHSMTRGLDNVELSGPLLYARAAYNSRAWDVATYYSDRSPDFRAPLGYITRVDIRKIGQEIMRSWHPEKHGIQAFRLVQNGFVDWDYQGTLQDWESESEFELEMSRQTELMIGRTFGYERFMNVGFPKHHTFLRAETAPWRWLSFSAEHVWGRSINYEPATGLIPFPVSFRTAEFSVTVKPKSQLQITTRYLWEGDDQHPMLRTIGTPHSVYNNHIVRMKVNYQFTKRLSLRGIMDYNAVLPNEALIARDRSKRLTGDVLATYMVNPWTAVYVGYTDQYDNLAFDNAGLHRTPSATTSTGRQFFAKVSYLFRF